MNEQQMIIDFALANEVSILMRVLIERDDSRLQEILDVFDSANYKIYDPIGNPNATYAPYRAVFDHLQTSHPDLYGIIQMLP